MRPCELAKIERQRRERAIGKIDHGYPFQSFLTKADAARLLAEVPPDTRGLTAKLMGDPLPGRRAIDRISRGQ